MADSLAATISENPFRPSDGLPPLVLAGRDMELHELREAVAITTRRPPECNLGLIGPRGNGKTCLLNELSGMAGDQVTVLAVSGADYGSPTEFVASATQAIADSPSLGDRFRKLLPTEVKMGPGGVGLGWKQSDSDHSESIEGFLGRLSEDGPVVLAIDEAHEIERDTLKSILNASQLVRRRDRRQLLIVLAGTTRLQETLRAARASFADRADYIPVGRLSEPDTERAFSETMARGDRSFSNAALAACVRESQGYSYFVQLLGREVYRTCVRSGSRVATQDDVASARGEFERRKNRYYGRRREELRAAGLTRPAVALAVLFGNRRSLPAEQVEETVSALFDAETDANDALTAISNTGFVWQPHGVDYEVGIPSLATFVREQSPALERRLEAEHAGLFAQR